MKKMVLAAMLCILLLSGCGRINFTTILSSKEVYTISDETCSVSTARLFLGIKKSAYEKRFGEDVWNQEFAGDGFEQYIKADVLDEMSDITLRYLFAKKNGTVLTDGEKEKVKQVSNVFYGALTSDQVEKTGVNQESIYEIVEKYALAEKVFDEMTGDIASKISDVDAKVIRVQSIFIKTFSLDDEGNRVAFGEQEIQSAKSKAADILDKATNGEDFAALAQEYSDDSTVEYTFCKSEMEEVFSEAAFSLKDGEISGVIETDKGFYVIRCLNSYLPDESAHKKTELIQKEKDEVFEKSYQPFVEGLNHTVNKRLWKNLSIAGIASIDINLYDAFDTASTQ
ncbi:peptidylprolyl isomerase [Parasporobacterium paucivorans]|uniref:PPIC-type PPIASE domain-containing protein n=1 Tax=Parasporobacterium paucivorans DSM 15970 TaxID=1122934 RepID=A0A1M6AIZ4_9FIRM|nr:peptidylprolyl isomerase [Parasporobacterium paucivorans]SHI36193.1 PPIC-type PPIASE domain-containing protein [Parasporobacterium paucivorans DSM 15970]